MTTRFGRVRGPMERGVRSGWVASWDIPVSSLKKAFLRFILGKQRSCRKLWSEIFLQKSGDGLEGLLVSLVIGPLPLTAGLDESCLL
jgi:hypothetical protein